MKKAFALIVLACSLLFCQCGLGKYISIGHGVAVGKSMSPTIEQGDHFGYGILKLGEMELLERFDIIVFKVNSGYDKQIKEDTQFVFRVIALEGEKVELQNGKVFINDKLLEEPFEKVESKDNFAPVVVPNGEYFVLGDNRPNSFDSRFWKNKTVKRSDVLGTASNIIRKEDYEKGKRW
ncbi:MAG: signal peptidase I [Pyrinomonadaceae bacterium]